METRPGLSVPYGAAVPSAEEPPVCLRGVANAARYRVDASRRETVIPARKGHTNPQPHNPERYKARNAVERGLGWLKGCRRVAPRYDQYAHRCLGFLYLAGAWIWLQSYLHTP